MTRMIKLNSRDGVPLVASYNEDEWDFMRKLRAGLDGENAEWDRETMLMIHELKAHLPGSVLVDETESSGILTTTS